jgi:hypothetical protein
MKTTKDHVPVKNAVNNLDVIVKSELQCVQSGERSNSCDTQWTRCPVAGQGVEILSIPILQNNQQLLAGLPLTQANLNWIAITYIVRQLRRELSSAHEIAGGSVQRITQKYINEMKEKNKENMNNPAVSEIINDLQYDLLWYLVEIPIDAYIKHRFTALNLKKILLLPDLHGNCPYPNEEEMKNVSHIIVLGDCLDHYAMAADNIFNRHKGTRTNEDLILEITEWMRELIRTYEGLQIYLIPGNHEMLAHTYLKNLIEELMKLNETDKEPDGSPRVVLMTNHKYTNRSPAGMDQICKRYRTIGNKIVMVGYTTSCAAHDNSKQIPSRDSFFWTPKDMIGGLIENIKASLRNAKHDEQLHLFIAAHEEWGLFKKNVLGNKEVQEVLRSAINIGQLASINVCVAHDHKEVGYINKDNIKKNAASILPGNVSMREDWGKTKVRVIGGDIPITIYASQPLGGRPFTYATYFTPKKREK